MLNYGGLVTCHCGELSYEKAIRIVGRSKSNFEPEVGMTASRGKTICFIDNANVFHGQYDSGWRIDWERFLKYLEEGEQIWQVYFFASETDPPREEASNFYQYLKEQLRWEVVVYPLGKKTIRCENCDHAHTTLVEKGVDIGLATKMLMLAMSRAFETAILVSGDRDYLETVKYIKGMGLRVEIISWRAGLSEAMQAESSAPVIYLDNLDEQIRRNER
jgi:uncharacterized LabA/DUF88 family protein